MLATLKQNGYGIMIDKGLNEMVWYGQVHIRKTERVKLYNRSMVTVIRQEHAQIGGYGMIVNGVNGNGNKLGSGTNSYGMIRKSE